MSMFLTLVVSWCTTPVFLAALTILVIYYSVVGNNARPEVRDRDASTTKNVPPQVCLSSLTPHQQAYHRYFPLDGQNQRMITISMTHLLEHEAELVSPALLEGLRDLMVIADVYFICNVSHAREKPDILTKLSDLGLVASSSSSTHTGHLILPHKVLFCSSNIGKVAIVRQMQPQVHVDNQTHMIQELQRHIPLMVLLVGHSSSSEVETHENVQLNSTLEVFLHELVVSSCLTT